MVRYSVTSCDLTPIPEHCDSPVDVYLADEVIELQCLLREARAHLAPAPDWLATMDRDALVTRISATVTPVQK